MKKVIFILVVTLVSQFAFAQLEVKVDSIFIYDNNFWIVVYTTYKNHSDIEKEYCVDEVLIAYGDKVKKKAEIFHSIYYRDLKKPKYVGGSGFRIDNKVLLQPQASTMYEYDYSVGNDDLSITKVDSVDFFLGKYYIKTKVVHRKTSFVREHFKKE